MLIYYFFKFSILSHDKLEIKIKSGSMTIEEIICSITCLVIVHVMNAGEYKISLSVSNANRLVTGIPIIRRISSANIFIIKPIRRKSKTEAKIYHHLPLTLFQLAL